MKEVKIVDCRVHISNSGATIGVSLNDKGLNLSVNQGTFGMMSASTDITLSAEMLKRIGEELIKASDFKFEKPKYYQEPKFLQIKNSIGDITDTIDGK